MNLGDEYTLILHGIPRTKKTHNETHLTVGKGKVVGWWMSLRGLAEKDLLRAILSRVKVQPSKNYRQWVRLCVPQWIGDRPELPIGASVSIRALIYRDRAIGDAVGFYQAIGDYLEETGLLKNDRLIEHWDGSRRLKDKDHPRIELTITVVSVPRETKGAQQHGLFETGGGPPGVAFDGPPGRLVPVDAHRPRGADDTDADG